MPEDRRIASLNPRQAPRTTWFICLPAALSAWISLPHREPSRWNGSTLKLVRSLRPRVWGAVACEVLPPHSRAMLPCTFGTSLSGLGMVLTLAVNQEEGHLPYLAQSAYPAKGTTVGGRTGDPRRERTRNAPARHRARPATRQRQRTAWRACCRPTTRPPRSCARSSWPASSAPAGPCGACSPMAARSSRARLMWPVANSASAIRARNPRHAWTNGFVERLQGTIPQELWRVVFRRRYFTSRPALQRALAGFMRYYNTERSHQGYRLRGRTPAALVWGVAT